MQIKANNIIVLFPTAMEAEPFTVKYGVRVAVELCGIGLAECAASTARVILQMKPELIILAGIAGAYEGKGLYKGDTVLVTREISADLGSMTDGGFRPLPKNGIDASENFYDCPTPLPDIFRQVVSNSVNTAATPHIMPGTADIENMEGAAFFAVCGALEVPFAEIRTVSNYVGEPRTQWIIPQATGKLADGVATLLEAINRNNNFE